MCELIKLIKDLSEAPEEIAEATLAEYRSERGHNEAIEAVFEIARIMRKEKATAEAVT